jgi:hypothetical protein
VNTDSDYFEIRHLLRENDDRKFVTSFVNFSHDLKHMLQKNFQMLKLLIEKGATTLSLTTFGLMTTLIIKGLFATLSILGTQNKDTA